MTDKVCPECYDVTESALPPDFLCPTCGRRRSLFLAAFQKSQQSEITDERILEIAESIKWPRAVVQEHVIAFARAVLKEGSDGKENRLVPVQR